LKERRLDRERKTIKAMIAVYCKGNHNSSKTLCGECSMLLDYAFKRIEKCPFRADKPTCAKCTVHCYKPDMRELVRKVMRYSGPRMMLHHPLLALLHLIDGFKITEKKKPGRVLKK